MDDGMMTWDDKMVCCDKEKMCRHHWEKYMHFKTMWECHKKMHDHCMMMMDYHNKMCMHYMHGHPMPPMPMMGYPAAVPGMAPAAVPGMLTTPPGSSVAPEIPVKRTDDDIQ